MLEIFGFICACYLLYQYIDHGMSTDEKRAITKATKRKTK